MKSTFYMKSAVLYLVFNELMCPQSQKAIQNTGLMDMFHIGAVLGVYTRSMETIYLSLVYP